MGGVVGRGVRNPAPRGRHYIGPDFPPFGVSWPAPIRGGV
jgi:hypothetical protein